MAICYVRFFWSAFLLLILLEGCKTWMEHQKDKDLLMGLSKVLVNDAMRKAEKLWGLKDDWQRYKTFGIGEKVFLIRTKMAEMIRSTLRLAGKSRTRTTTELIKKLTSVYRMSQELILFLGELTKYDSEVRTENKLRNDSRLKAGENCQAAGTMVVHHLLLENYRRQFIDDRRQHIVNTYIQEKSSIPIDIEKELSELVEPKLTRRHEVKNQDNNLAPDIM